MSKILTIHRPSVSSRIYNKLSDQDIKRIGKSQENEDFDKSGVTTLKENPPKDSIGRECLDMFRKEYHIMACGEG